MTTGLYCLFIAVLLPYLIAGSSAYFRIKQFGVVNNQNPRQQAAALEGAGARIVAAQANAWEALLVFASALFIANVSGVDASVVTTASIIFIVGRVLHPICYVANLATLRSISFVVAMGSCLWLIGSSLFT